MSNARAKKEIVIWIRRNAEKEKKGGRKPSSISGPRKQSTFLPLPDLRKISIADGGMPDKFTENNTHRNVNLVRKQSIADLLKIAKDVSNEDVSRQMSAVNVGRQQTTADILEFDPNMIIKFAEGDGNAMDGIESHSKDPKLKHLIITVSLL